MEKQAKPRRRRIGWWILGFILFVPIFPSSHGDGSGTLEYEENLYQLHPYLQKYRASHNGKLPQDLTQCVPDPSFVQCVPLKKPYEVRQSTDGSQVVVCADILDYQNTINPLLPTWQIKFIINETLVLTSEGVVFHIRTMHQAYRFWGSDWVGFYPERSGGK